MPVCTRSLEVDCKEASSLGYCRSGRLARGKDAYTGGPRTLGILQRYVIGEVTRSFGLALLTMTAIFVLFMVAAQARDIGLSPSDIMHLVPYVIPSTLPYTIPVSLLFAATVVYGRLAGDNEIIAIKTAGLSVWRVLVPILVLAGALSVWLLYVSGGWIPRCTHNAKLVLFKDIEDMFYKLLAKEREFNHPKWPFLIKVRDVQGDKMIDATFKHKIKGSNDYDAVIQAREATLHFDLDAKVVRVFLKHSELQHFARDADVFLINNDTLEIPIPPDSKMSTEKKIQEFSNAELMAELAKNHKQIETVRKMRSDQGRICLRLGPPRLDQLGRGQFGVSRSSRLGQEVQRARDRVASPIFDGSRQLAVRVPGRASRESCSPGATS